MHRLITICISHYNEKARWALDRFHVRYRESPYMPLMHIVPVWAATLRRADAAADHVSSRFSTPVLVTDDGRRICDSSRIVRYVSDRFGPAGTPGDLYPDPEVEALEKRFHDELGPHTRRWAYFYALDDLDGARAVARANVGRVQAAVFSAMAPLGARLIKRSLDVDAEHTKRSRQHIVDELAFVSDRLVGGAGFLVGDRFTAADLAFACMAAPALLIGYHEGYGAVAMSIDDAHPDAAAFARELRATPAGAFALRLFREERRAGHQRSA